MSKLNNLIPSVALSCFSEEAGVHFEKLCADISSELGRIEKDIVSKSGDWTVATKGRIVSKEGHALQLPLNAAWTVLLRFGMQVNVIAKNGSNFDTGYRMGIQAGIPFEAKAWFEKNYAANKGELKVAAK